MYIYIYIFICRPINILRICINHKQSHDMHIIMIRDIAKQYISEKLLKIMLKTTQQDSSKCLELSR